MSLGNIYETLKIIPYSYIYCCPPPAPFWNPPLHGLLALCHSADHPHSPLPLPEHLPVLVPVSHFIFFPTRPHPRAWPVYGLPPAMLRDFQVDSSASPLEDSQQTPIYEGQRHTCNNVRLWLSVMTDETLTCSPSSLTNLHFPMPPLLRFNLKLLVPSLYQRPLISLSFPSQIQPTRSTSISDPPLLCEGR